MIIIKIKQKQLNQYKMNASRFANKNIIEALQNFQNYEIHQKKLKKIKQELELKKKGKLSLVNEEDLNLKMRVITNKLKNHEFQDNEKILEIQRENTKLMNKLYEISQGKQSTLRNLMGDNYGMIQKALQNGMIQQQMLIAAAMANGGELPSEINDTGVQSQMNGTLKQGSKLHAHQQSVSGIQSVQKSLHMPYRKREMTRIDIENQKLSERLNNAQPSMPLKKFEEEYQNHLKLKKNIQKSGQLPIEQLILKHRKMLGGMESQLGADDSGKQEILSPIKKRSTTSQKKAVSTARNSQDVKASNLNIVINDGIVQQKGQNNNTTKANDMKSTKSHQVLPIKKGSQMQTLEQQSPQVKKIAPNQTEQQLVKPQDQKKQNVKQSEQPKVHQSQTMASKKGALNQDIKPQLTNGKQSAMTTKSQGNVQSSIQYSQGSETNNIKASLKLQEESKPIKVGSQDDEVDYEDEYSQFEEEAPAQQVDEDSNEDDYLQNSYKAKKQQQVEGSVGHSQGNSQQKFSFDNFKSPKQTVQKETKGQKSTQQKKGSPVKKQVAEDSYEQDFEENYEEDFDQ